METTAKRGVHPLIIAISAVLALGIAASCTLSALALRSVSAQEEAVTELRDTFNGLVSGGEEAVTQEDDVAVGGDYWIRSTLPISDAYKSGDASALSEKEAETLEMASEVLGGIITGGMTVYEKEKAVYDWMCSNIHHEGGITVVVPTASEYSAEPYGVLKYRQAVCVGFATTFRMFMQMLDIECKVVHNSYHSWDLVRLDDGEWYHVDIYSDAGRGDYANFNMNDELASGGHDWDRDFFPAAEGLEYCYSYQNAEPLEDIFALPQYVREALDAGGSRNLYYLTPSSDAQAQSDAAEMLSRLSDAANAYGMGQGRDLYIDYNAQLMGDGLLLSVLITDYSELEDPDETMADVERIDEAISEAFDGAWTGGDGSGIDWDYVIDAEAETEVLG